MFILPQESHTRVAQDQRKKKEFKMPKCENKKEKSNGQNNDRTIKKMSHETDVL